MRGYALITLNIIEYADFYLEIVLNMPEYVSAVMHSTRSLHKFLSSY